MSDFKGKTVIVTGAAGALGAAVVQHFANLGARIAQLDVAAIDNAHYSDHCDLTSHEACKAAVTAILGQFGSVDVLANIAGGFAVTRRMLEMFRK